MSQNLSPFDLLKNNYKLLIYFIVSFFLIVISVILSLFSNDSLIDVVSIIISTLGSCIFFPLLIGFFYDKLKEEKSGESIWMVFKELSEGGILRIFKNRERSNLREDGFKDLNERFLNHLDGEIKMIGVSLRVFFNQTGSFWKAIKKLLDNNVISEKNPIKVLICNPKSSEVKNRALVETPNIKKPMIKQEIALTISSMELHPKCIEYKLYNQAPYCTLVIFPEKCYYSPNLLSTKVPVGLPLIVFRKDSHGYNVLNEYFKIIWKSNEKEEK